MREVVVVASGRSSVVSSVVSRNRIEAVVTAGGRPDVVVKGGSVGVQGLPGPSPLYQQPDEPDLTFPPDPSFLWLDTDEEPPAIADGSKIGNLLTENQASAGALNGFVLGDFQMTGGTASVITEPDGTYLRCSVTAANPSIWLGKNGATLMPVVGGRTHTARALFRMSGSHTGVSLLFYSYGADGAALDSAVSMGRPNPNPLTLNEWNEHRWQFTPHPDATKVMLRFYVSGMAASDTFDGKEFGLWQGAGGNWAMPGVPITGLGRRVTHPNGDDVLVEVWDEGKGRWQRVHYDSGWRDVTSEMMNGNSRRLHVRRLVDQVHINGDVDLANIEVWALPLWARPTTSAAATGAGRDLTSNAITLVEANAGTNRLYIRGTTGRRFQFELVYAVSQPIPASLPGTLVTAAPN